jgi:hypothetical protein
LILRPTPHVSGPVGVKVGMRLSLKALVVMLGFVLLCVPAAVAKNGNGHSHGKPSWAGQGNGHEKAAKPAKVEHEKAKPEKAAHEKKAKKEKEHAQAGSEADGESESAEDGGLDLDDLNPAWYCKTLEAMMNEADAEAAEGGAEPSEVSSFDAEFGENENKRNSFGKCVSRRAHGEDLSGALDGEGDSADGNDDSAGENEDKGEEGEDQAGEERDGEDEDGELAAFARALVSFIRL